MKILNCICEISRAEREPHRTRSTIRTWRTWRDFHAGCDNRERTRLPAHLASSCGAVTTPPYWYVTI